MMRRVGRWGTWVVVLCATLASTALAKPGIVRTNDGQSFEGDVNDTDANEVVVTVRNIPVRIPRTRVSGIEYTQGFEQQYAERMAKLQQNPKDAAGRIQLGKEAMAAKKYELARDAFESALVADNNNAEATQLLETNRSLWRLERKAAMEPPPATTRPTTPAPAHGEAPAAATTTQPAGSANVLTAAQINRIKQLEMRPDDREVRIRFEHGVQKRFVDSNPNYPAQRFYALNPMQQAQAILNEGALEMASDVTIVNDPPGLLTYRRVVQPFILQNCATSACHGGGAKSFNLLVPAETEAVGYTNFYTLSHYVKGLKSGDQVFGQGEARILDRARPEASLLLQYSIPSAQAEQRHPELAGYKPLFRGMNDNRYSALLGWISNSIQPVEPDYGIASHAAATSQPATEPAATTQTTTEPAATKPAPAPPATRPVQPPPRQRPPQPARPVAPPRLPR